VLEQCAAELSALSLPRFIPWSLRALLAPSPSLYYANYICPPLGFQPDPRKPAQAGVTVTFAALQLAFFMGFEQVILVGVDHNFETKGPAHETVTSQGDDPNHFAPNYFGKGFRWQLPDLENSERDYVFARDAYQKAGRSVVDATIGGKLTIFPKVSYDGLFEG
jgi:hypothetical protein